MSLLPDQKRLRAGGSRRSSGGGSSPLPYRPRASSLRLRTASDTCAADISQKGRLKDLILAEDAPVLEALDNYEAGNPVPLQVLLSSGYVELRHAQLDQSLLTGGLNDTLRMLRVGGGVPASIPHSPMTGGQTGFADLLSGGSPGGRLQSSRRRSSSGMGYVDIDAVFGGGGSSGPSPRRWGRGSPTVDPTAMQLSLSQSSTPRLGLTLPPLSQSSTPRILAQGTQNGSSTQMRLNHPGERGSNSSVSSLDAAAAAAATSSSSSAALHSTLMQLQQQQQPLSSDADSMRSADKAMQQQQQELLPHTAPTRSSGFGFTDIIAPPPQSDFSMGGTVISTHHTAGPPSPSFPPVGAHHRRTGAGKHGSDSSNSSSGSGGSSGSSSSSDDDGMDDDEPLSAKLSIMFADGGMGSSSSVSNGISSKINSRSADSVFFGAGSAHGGTTFPHTTDTTYSVLGNLNGGVPATIAKATFAADADNAGAAASSAFIFPVSLPATTIATAAAAIGGGLQSQHFMPGAGVIAETQLVPSAAGPSPAGRQVKRPRGPSSALSSDAAVAASAAASSVAAATTASTATAATSPSSSSNLNFSAATVPSRAPGYEIAVTADAHNHSMYGNGSPISSDGGGASTSTIYASLAREQAATTSFPPAVAAASVSRSGAVFELTVDTAAPTGRPVAHSLTSSTGRPVAHSLDSVMSLGVFRQSSGDADATTAHNSVCDSDSEAAVFSPGGGRQQRQHTPLRASVDAPLLLGSTRATVSSAAGQSDAKSVFAHNAANIEHSALQQQQGGIPSVTAAGARPLLPSQTEPTNEQLLLDFLWNPARRDGVGAVIASTIASTTTTSSSTAAVAESSSSAPLPSSAMSFASTSSIASNSSTSPPGGGSGGASAAAFTPRGSTSRVAPPPSSASWGVVGVARAPSLEASPPRHPALFGARSHVRALLSPFQGSAPSDALDAEGGERGESGDAAVRMDISRAAAASSGARRVHLAITASDDVAAPGRGHYTASHDVQPQPQQQQRSFSAAAAAAAASRAVWGDSGTAAATAATTQSVSHSSSGSSSFSPSGCASGGGGMPQMSAGADTAAAAAAAVPRPTLRLVRPTSARRAAAATAAAAAAVMSASSAKGTAAAAATSGGLFSSSSSSSSTSRLGRSNDNGARLVLSSLGPSRSFSSPSSSATAAVSASAAAPSASAAGGVGPSSSSSATTASGGFLGQIRTVMMTSSRSFRRAQPAQSSSSAATSSSSSVFSGLISSTFGASSFTPADVPAPPTSAKTADALGVGSNAEHRAAAAQRAGDMDTESHESEAPDGMWLFDATTASHFHGPAPAVSTLGGARAQLESDLAPGFDTLAAAAGAGAAHSPSVRTRPPSGRQSRAVTRPGAVSVSEQSSRSSRAKAGDRLPPPTAAAASSPPDVRLLGAYTLELRVQRINAFLAKRVHRKWTKSVTYEVRKNFADTRLRVHGRFVQKQEENLLASFFQLL